MLHVDVKLMRSLGGQTDASSDADVEFTRPVLQDPLLVVQLQQLFKAWAHRGAREAADGLTRLADESALTLLCTHVLTHHTTARLPSNAPASIGKVRDMLAAEVLNPPSLQALSAPLGLSRYQLLRRFTEVYGLPPHAWLRAYRLERARALIAQGVPLAATAAESGFADQSHIARLCAWRQPARAATAFKTKRLKLFTVGPHLPGGRTWNKPSGTTQKNSATVSCCVCWPWFWWAPQCQPAN